MIYSLPQASATVLDSTKAIGMRTKKYILTQRSIGRNDLAVADRQQESFYSRKYGFVVLRVRIENVKTQMYYEKRYHFELKYLKERP